MEKGDKVGCHYCIDETAATTPTPWQPLQVVLGNTAWGTEKNIEGPHMPQSGKLSSNSTISDPHWLLFQGSVVKMHKRNMELCSTWMLQ